ncbi:hypothetical protein BCT61_17320 [Vibrio breoganii]|uniref:EpsG family protein n=1 Tax=Vibrio breoganii TaxID=553239 RepID=UPI000C837AA1|nr:EpsG family protein [Vibrio breoganii]PMM04013.1 hypothetical protein BCT61_17320 [Vibrio breoganii]
MLFSLTIYGLTAAILTVLGYVSYLNSCRNLGLNRSFFSWENCAIVGVFGTVCGLRYNVGVDYKAYLEYFLTYQRFGEFTFKSEWLFESLTKLVSFMSLGPSTWFAIIACIQIGCFYFAFKDHRYLYPFFSLIIVLGPHYLVWMNGMRQILASAIFMIAIRYILSRRLIWFLSVIICASLFHKSAIILLALYFIPNRDYFKNRTFTIALIFSSIALGSINLVSDYVNEISFIANFIGYENVSYHLSNLVNESAVKSWGPRNLLLIFTAVLLAWTSREVKDYYKSDVFLIFYNMTIASVIFGNVLMNAHNIFLRPIIYLNMTSIVTCAFTLYFLFIHGSSKYYGLLFFALLLSVVMYMPLSVVADYGKSSIDFTNYKTILFQDLSSFK